VKRSHRVYDAFKRAGDLIVSLVAMVLLSPVLAITALLVRRRLGSPVIVSQLLPGRGGVPFRIHKFRTMRDAQPGDSDVAAVGTDAERLSGFGRKLRSTSLDELPELWNVLRGDMSIVGPRPLLMEYLDRYTTEQARRHEVRPGITGWAQVNGRNAVSWEDRFAMDVWYVDHRSFPLDVRIVFMTIAAVFKRSGISSGGHATMEPFDPGRGSSGLKGDS
jgi:sugar transferase EpsL